MQICREHFARPQRDAVPPRFRPGRICATIVWVLMIGTAGLAQVAEVAPRLETHRLSADEAEEMQLWLDLLREPTAELKLRRGAARSLLKRNWGPAIKSMRDMLANERTDPGASRAIAMAVAATDQPPAALIDPLIALVGSSDADTAQAVASALARYDNPKVVNELLALTEDASNGEKVHRTRLAAIRALAEHRHPRVAERLVALTDPAQPAAIQQAAFSALARLTGINTFGQEHQAWADWWQQCRVLSLEQWQAGLIRQLGGETAQLRDRSEEMAGQLAYLYGRLYVATPEDDRPAVLIRMLSDPIATIRLASMELIERAILSAQPDPTNEEMRQAMRDHLLDDPDPLVRAAVALRLHDLGDAAAPPLVVARLLEEPDPLVQRAYLILLTPADVSEEAAEAIRRACSPALTLFEEPELSSQVADLLIVAHDNGVLGPQHTAEALQHARRQTADAEPDVAMLRLLGRLGQAEDWPTLTRMLSSPSEEIRRTAAESFIRGAMPLDPLMGQLSDPTLRPIALRAAEHRGGRLDIARRLLDAAPANGDNGDRWQAAVKAVAGRLAPADLIALDNLLIPQDSWRSMREQIIKAVVSQVDNGTHTSPNESDQTLRAEMLLRLSRLYLDTQRPALALAAYDRFESVDALSSDQAAAYQRGRFEAHLASEQLDEALALAESLVTTPQGATEAIELLLEAAERSLAERPEYAARIADVINSLGGENLPEEARDRLEDLNRALGEAGSREPEGSAPGEAPVATSPDA